MIFYLHYILLTSGLSGTSVLLGVFIKAYSDASQAEIGVLLMTLPFLNILIRLIFCSMADRHQAYRLYLVSSLCIMLLGFMPLIVVPFFPDFYTKHPRVSWYLLVMACYIGNGALAVAWSLGESLAINKAQRTKTPYGRMRLMGTVSWGVVGITSVSLFSLSAIALSTNAHLNNQYGYIIGQINEVPYLPKFVPAFVILNVSVILEIVLILLWDKQDFVMFDGQSEEEKARAKAVEQQQSLSIDYHDKSRVSTLKSQTAIDQQVVDNIIPCSSCTGGTLSLSSATGKVVRDLLAADGELEKKIALSSQNSLNKLGGTISKANSIELQQSIAKTLDRDCELADVNGNQKDQTSIQGDKKRTNKNPQIILFKLICAEDGRVIKYFMLFTMVGVLLAPINFVFLSLDDLCREKSCNFSNLAGLVLVSQAACETLCFLIMPWILKYVSRSLAMAFGFFILVIRYFFYAEYYYTSNISPYWALVGEWGHGMSYSIFATIAADIALMFANQTRWFLPEMRQLGYLSDRKAVSKEATEAEETSMKMALRATMQALISGLMDGIGYGIGSLVSGSVSAFSYTKLWQLMSLMSIGSLIIHQLVEVSRCRWSDTFKPRQGTKAYDIRTMTATASGSKGDVKGEA